MDPTAYRPAPHVLDHLQSVTFVAVVGPTAAGKTALIKQAAATHPELRTLVSCVSRSPRPDEQEGIDFHFRDKASMQARAGRGEYATSVLGVSGDIYATAPEDYEPHKTMLMATLAGAMPLFRALPFKRLVSVFIVPPDWETWQKRLQSHNFTPEQRRKRLAEARRSLQFALDDPETKLIISKDVDQAAEDLVVVALGRPLPARLEADQARARDVVRSLLTRLTAGS